MKKVLYFTIIVVIVMLCGCQYKEYFGNRPCDQPETKWVSEDGTIVFSVGENSLSTGTIQVGDTEIDVFISIGPATQIQVYPLESVDGNTVNGFPFETWHGDFKHDNRFTATIEETTYFEVGERIVFHRVDSE